MEFSINVEIEIFIELSFLWLGLHVLFINDIKLLVKTLMLVIHDDVPVFIIKST